MSCGHRACHSNHRSSIRGKRTHNNCRLFMLPSGASPLVLLLNRVVLSCMNASKVGSGTVYKHLECLAFVLRS